MDKIEYTRKFPEGFEDYIILNRDDQKGASFEVRISSHHGEANGKDLVASSAELLASTQTQHQVEAEMQAYEKKIAETDAGIIELLHQRGAAMSGWLLHNLTFKLQQVRLPEEHSGMLWIDRRDPSRTDILVDEDISNRVYTAHIEMKEVGKKQALWAVSYYLQDNRSSVWKHRVLQSIDRKQFRDKAKAEQYLQGRKSWLERTYFASLEPMIPEEFESAFLIDGAKIPVYSYASDLKTEDEKKGSAKK